MYVRLQSQYITHANAIAKMVEGITTLSSGVQVQTERVCSKLRVAVTFSALAYELSISRRVIQLVAAKKDISIADYDIH